MLRFIEGFEDGVIFDGGHCSVVGQCGEMPFQRHCTRLGVPPYRYISSLFGNSP